MALITGTNTQVTLNKFGLPVTTGDNTTILTPKYKNRFRVLVFGFGNTPSTATNDFTRQVATCGRPNRNFNDTALHIYNNVVYLPQKPEWDPIDITLRDDINNAASSLVSAQLNSQMNTYTQAAAPAGANFKFTMLLQTLDGTMGDDNVLEQWNLEGCYIQQVQYGDMDFSSSEPMMMTLTIRYDNATQGDEQALSNFGPVSLAISNQPGATP